MFEGGYGRRNSRVQKQTTYFNNNRFMPAVRFAGDQSGEG